MKLNYGTIELIYSALKSLEEQELPIDASIPITRGIAALEKEIKIFTNAKDKLIRKYGKPTKENTIQILPTDATWQSYVKEIVPILQMEIEVNYTDPMIPVEKLGSKINITPQNLRALQGLKIVTGLVEPQIEGEAREIPIDETSAVSANEDVAESVVEEAKAKSISENISVVEDSDKTE